MTARRRREQAPDTSLALAERIVNAPRASDVKMARRKVDEWMSEHAGSAGASAIKDILTEHPKVRSLLEGIADGSPFLWDLASREPERLAALLNTPPHRHFDDLLARTGRGVDATDDDATTMHHLRRMKAEGALLIAIADIGGAWPLAEVTAALTRLADTAIEFALRHLLRAAAARGQMRLQDSANPTLGCGYFALAMGKMGAFELNYSSDIDLICLFDPQAPQLAPETEPGPFFIRLTRSLVRMLQERTVDGYVFRVDLRLRPDPGLTQIALSTDAALGYYESVGQNWERQALIKARPCAGDIAAGEAFLDKLSPFIWRKYLDYAAIADVQAMKRQIHSYRGHDEIAVEGHNIKLGRGGIREVEFFAQTQQLIAGGRNPALRGRGTLATLDALAAGGWISAKARRELSFAYTFLRRIEHRLQMVNDEQTHTLPADPEQLEAFARFAGFKDRDVFAAPLLEHLRIVQGHYARLFEQTPTSPAERVLSFPPEKDDRDTLDRLSTMGFKRPLEASATIRNWFGGSYRALKGELARTHLAELVPALLKHLARGSDPDAALLAFDRFLAGLAAGARLISLLRQNPDLLALVALVLATAPRLADILGQHPQAIDAVIDPGFFAALPGEAALESLLDRALAESRSYEDLLDGLRLFRSEHLFLIGTRILSGTITARQAGAGLAALAEALIRRAHAAVEARFIEQHGRLPGQQMAVLAMGKLGGREMTAGSDLDLIVVYDFDAASEHAESDGPRPLYGQQYSARLTQRFIGALTAQTTYGALYPVDMRLRPSGRSGPVATQLGSFEDYQRREAWTWEHMALTRARVISSPPAFARQVEEAIAGVLRQPRDRDTIAADVVEMRHAIATEKGEDDRWELKYAAGGLVDLEFIAQYLQLVHATEHPEILSTTTGTVLDTAARLRLIAPEDGETLRSAIRLYQDLTQILRLCLSEPFDPKAAGAGLLGLLARAADLPDFATLDAHLIDIQARVRASFDRILGAP